MQHRTAQTVYWPGIKMDIKQRLRYATCIEAALLQAHVSMMQLEGAKTPFESITNLGEVHYLVTVDRLSGWLYVTRVASGLPASGLIACLRDVLADRGVLDTLLTDSRTKFTLQQTQEFHKTWKVHHRVSSAHHPQSNRRAEAAMRSAKRLLRGHTGLTGNLDKDAFMLAIMAHHNTLDILTGLSLANVLYRCPLRDTFHFVADIGSQTWTCTQHGPRPGS